MKLHIKAAILLTAVASAIPATAQYTTSAYFLDGYNYRHLLNPAFGNDSNLYFSVPALGNWNVSLAGNLNLDDILYNVNGQTTTFLNPGVSSSEFLGNISDKNSLNLDLRLDILSVGFKGFGGYNTIGIAARSNVAATIPGSLLRLAKEGPANDSYDISDFKAHADAYAEIAFGHSRQINQKLRVGGKLKFLVGLANVDADFSKASLTLGTDGWTAVTNATVQASIKGLSYITEQKLRGPEGSKTTHTYVSDLDLDNTGINGFGLAIDLGADYTLNSDWEFSAALLDLGFISWNNNMVASTNGDKSFDTDTYIFNVDKDASNSFGDELDRLAEGLSTLYELQDNGDTGGRTKMIAATLNLAAQYTLPVYNKLKFGLLNTTRIQEDYTWTDFRLSANVRPIKLISAALSASAGTYGCSVGWLFNLNAPGFNFFIGMDRIPLKFSKQYVPLSSNASINFGFNVQL